MPLHPWCEMCQHARPGVNRDASCRGDAVDETAVSGAELQHTVPWCHQTGKMATPESPPQHVASQIVGEACVKVLVGAHARHPKHKPAIIRRPTRRALTSLTLPPLLTPTRGWKVIG